MSDLRGGIYREISTCRASPYRQKIISKAHASGKLQSNLGGVVNIQLHFHFCDVASPGPFNPMIRL